MPKTLMIIWTMPRWMHFKNSPKRVVSTSSYLSIAKGKIWKYNLLILKTSEQKSVHWNRHKSVVTVC